MLWLVDFRGIFINVMVEFVFAFPVGFQFLSGTPPTALGVWNHRFSQWQGAKVLLSTVPASRVQTHFLWEAAEETCRRWKTVNAVILAKLQGFFFFLVCRSLFAIAAPPPSSPKACGRTFISCRRGQVKHVKLHIWVKHKHLLQRLGVICVCVCVCVYKSNIALLYCVIPDVLSQSIQIRQIFEACNCATCQHFELVNLGLDG